jgi:hypothetical protein
LSSCYPSPFDYCVILIVEDENKYTIEGHWTALLRYNGIYEYFDPYGNPIDYDLIHWMDKEDTSKAARKQTLFDLLIEKVNNTPIIKLNTRCYERGQYLWLALLHIASINLRNITRTLEEYQRHMLEVSKQYGIGFDKIVASFVSFFLR